MISYSYAQLAVGNHKHLKFNYFDFSKQFTLDKNLQDDAKVYVTTDCAYDENIPNLVVTPFDTKYKTLTEINEGGIWFNYCLKFLCLKDALKHATTDYIILIDADFAIEKGYTRKGVEGVLQLAKDRDLDIFAYHEDTALSVDGIVPSQRPWLHKVEVSGLRNITGLVKSYGETIVFFKNTPKLHKMVEHWEHLYQTYMEHNINQYSESLDIGIAASIAGMNGENSLIKREYEQHLPKCFSTPVGVNENGFIRYYMF